MGNKTHIRLLRNVFLFQGAYFAITGIWPILSMDSFIAATGPKQDTWLVETIGLLSLSIGITYIVSALRGRHLPLLLGFTVASSFLIMDIIYVSVGTMTRIYLLDAGIQLAVLLMLTFLTIKNSKEKN